jgi:hypothetical protein
VALTSSATSMSMSSGGEQGCDPAHVADDPAEYPILRHPIAEGPAFERFQQLVWRELADS